MADTTLIRWAGEELLRVVGPLRDALDDAEAMAALLTSLGWNVSTGALDMNAINSAIGIEQDLETAARQIPALADIEDDPMPAIALAIALVSAIAKSAQLANSPAPQALAQAWPSLSQDLPPEMVGRYLETYRPGGYAGLLLTGIAVETKVEPPQGSTDRVAYVKREFEWSRIGTVLSHPDQVLRDAFGWGTQNGLDQATADRLARALRLIGAPAQTVTPTTQLLDLYYAQNHPQRAGARAIELTLVDAWEFDTGAEIAARLTVLPVPSPANASGPPAGVVIVPAVSGTATGPTAWPFGVTLEGALGLDQGVRIELIPGSRTAVTADASTEIDARVAFARPVAKPLTLLGDPSATSLKMRGEHIALGVSGPVSDPEVRFTAGVEELRFVLDPGQADGFLGRFLGKERQELSLKAAVTWSSEKGISFEGGAQLRLRFPLKLHLGVVDIFVLTVGLDVDGSGFGAAIGADGRLTLGPLTVNVENVGILVRLVPAAGGQKPTVGDLVLGFGFKPPNGLGVAIAAGPAAGGGYVSFDFKEEQYAGALQLNVKMLQLSVIGLLTTKMPDGSKGFSFLLIVSAQFQPIQLGYGFSLLGVGGLVGINRGVNVDYLRSGLKDGTLDSVRFPKDVAKNAQKIISDLRASFPVAENRFVFGPMVAIGWGSRMLRLEIGLILELPSPVRLLILGQLSLSVPDPDAAVVLLKLDILGVIDFGSGEVSLDGSLRDSRIAIFPVTGDLAMRASFGSQPTFAFSAGGFNPRFQPPPKFPQLARMGITIGYEDNPRLRAEAYFAVTANSLQLGAALDIYFDKDLGALGHFTVDGHMGFDGLLQFDPFGLLVEISARLILKRNGTNFVAITLSMTLSGPQPWHAWGDARFEVMGLEQHMAFDLTAGDPPPPHPLEPVNPIQMLIDALQLRESWSAQAPQLGQRPIVTLQPLDPADDEVVVHPLGRLTVRQRVLPLDLSIEMFGHQPLADGARNVYTIKGAQVGGKAADSLDEVRDHFAPGDFFALSDDEKLARPAFEPLKAGVALSADAMGSGRRQQANMGYRELIVDDPQQLPTESTTLHHLSPSVLTSLAASSPVARSAVQMAADERYANDRPLVSVAGPAYAVASRETMAPAAGTTTYATFAEAEQARLAQNNPASLQVVGAQEVGQ